MPRVYSMTADPAAAAASLLRRVGFTILMTVVPVTALFTRRAVVVLAPVGIVLLVLAAVLDGNSASIKERLRSLVLSPGGLAAGVALGWCVLSLVWTPFLAQASERLVNIAGVLIVMLAGYLCLPDRMRSANLYILPVGVGLAALCSLALAGLARYGRASAEDAQIERGLIVLILFLWPAVGWLRSRGRHVEALVLALAVAVATMTAPQAMPLQALAAGAAVFAIAAVSARAGTAVTATLIAGLLLLAPLVPIVLTPFAKALLGAGDPTLESLRIWRSVVLNEPLRLITGHGFETALRGRTVGFWRPQAPVTVLFEVWYELGFVGAVAASYALYGREERGTQPSSPGAGHDGVLRDGFRLCVPRDRHRPDLVVYRARRCGASLRRRRAGPVPHHAPEGDPAPAPADGSRSREAAVSLSGRSFRDRDAPLMHRMAGHALGERRHLRPAALVGERAARMEGAAGRRIDRVRNLALDRLALPAGHARGPAPRRAACACRDASARANSSRAGAISTMRPRYITPMRFAMWRTTARLWLMNR